MKVRRSDLRAQFNISSLLNLHQCLDESKEPMMNLRKEACSVWLEDYNECLHHQKRRTREYIVERERLKQQGAATN